MELPSLLLVSILLILLSFLYSTIHYFKKEKSSNSTVLKNYPLIGTLPHFAKNSGRFLDWATELVVASPTNTVTVSPVIFTGNPSNIEHMLKTNFENYPKGEQFTSMLKDFLGQGIFNADGEQWKVQRKTASFEFNAKSLRAFVMERIRHEMLGSLVPLLKKASLKGDTVDLQDVFERFAFDNVCSLVFDEDPKCLTGGNKEGSRFFHAFEEATLLSVERMIQPLPFIWKLKKRFNIGSERRLKESVEIVHEYTGDFVRSRRRKSGRAAPRPSRDDLLSRLATDNTLSEEFLRDALISFVLAGRDTTPTALTWFFWVILSRPSIIHNILEELESVRARHNNYGEILTLEQIRDMQYLHAAISESLRLHPPVPLQQRRCREDDVMPDGTSVRKGWTVMYNSYAMGRMEKIWGEDCMEVKPERWLDEKGVFRPENPFKYPVFHAGPRMCLGKEMAYIQMKAVAASLLERFEMEVVGECGKHELSMSLRMRGGLKVKVKEREPKKKTV